MMRNDSLSIFVMAVALLFLVVATIASIGAG